MSKNPYAVAIFVSRESTERAMRTIVSALASALPGTVIDVLINGNPELARSLPSLCRNISVPKEKRLRLWNIELGDKANAWNQFAHSVFEDQEIVWFMDGYVTPIEGSFLSMQEGLKNHSSVLGATGVPTDGVSAARLQNEMRESGGLHGNLFCVRGSVIKRIADQEIRLPLGLYWVDGLVCALLNFNLKPSDHEWNPKRVWIDYQATWASDSLGALNMEGLMIQVRRAFRQARGRVENLALRDFLHTRKRNPETLPNSVNELVSNWVKENPLQAASSILSRPWRLYALRQLIGRRDWSSQCMRAELIAERFGT